MARNRQRAKERKQRQQQQRDPGLDQLPDDAPDGSVVLPDDAPGSSVFPSLGSGAPPTDLGSVQPVDFDDVDLEEEEEVPEVETPVPRKKGGVRVVAFIKACWAELQRVQWPDRRQVGQATAVVLGFVVIAGAFLGFADFVAQRIVNLII